MELQEFLNELLTVVIIPMILVLGKYTVNLLKSKIDDLKSQKEIKDNTLVQKYIDNIEDIIIKAIKTTNQEYTDVLKANGTWKKENFETAFDKTKTSVMKLLTEENKELIKTIYGDIDEFIKTEIESYIGDK